MIYWFTKENWKAKLIKLPVEDAYLIDEKEKIFAVADGITRDCLNGIAATPNRKGAWNIFWDYPRPSPAKTAADISCETSLKVLRDYNPQNRDEKAIWNAIEEGNKNVKIHQEKNFLEINYLENDFPGCVIAVACQYENQVYYGFIADCGIAIFNKKGVLKKRTPNEGPNYGERGEYLQEVVEKMEGGKIQKQDR